MLMTMGMQPQYISHGCTMSHMQQVSSCFVLKFIPAKEVAENKHGPSGSRSSELHSYMYTWGGGWMQTHCSPRSTKWGRRGNRNSPYTILRQLYFTE